MNTAIFMLGSNSNAESHITLALRDIDNIFIIKDKSTKTTTKPYGDHYVNDFINIAVKVDSAYTLDETVRLAKEIEKRLGRSPESKQLGLIPIDIDIIIWNEKIIHKDYERFDFVKKCVNEIL